MASWSPTSTLYACSGDESAKSYLQCSQAAHLASDLVLLSNLFGLVGRIGRGVVDDRDVGSS